MIELDPVFDIDDELLIRSLVNRILIDGSSPTILRVGFTPQATFPQLLLRAGIRKLIIGESYSEQASSSETSFLWRGIDGSELDVHSDSGKFPKYKWFGELPLPKSQIGGVHRNLQTKLWNVLSRVEFLSSCSAEAQVNYPHDQVNPALLLLSMKVAKSAASVNLELVKEAIVALEALADSAFDALAATVNTRGIKRPVMVMGSLSSFMAETVLVPLGATESPVAAVGPDGEVYPVQILTTPEDTGNAAGSRFAIFTAKNVPLYGYAVWDLAATSIPPEVVDEVMVSSTTIENNRILLEFDATSGHVLRIYDKETDREVLGDSFDVQRSGKQVIKPEACANVFSWQIDTADPVTPKLDKIEIVEKGPVRGSLRFTRSIPGTAIEILQEVRLTAESSRIDFVTDIKNLVHGSHLLVRNPISINAINTVIGNGFGFIQRPVYNNTGVFGYENDWDQPDWIDYAEGDYGVAFITNRGCAVKVEGQTVTLNLTGGETDVNPAETYRVCYSLLPHAGDLAEGEVIENSRALAEPPWCKSITGNRPAGLPLERSFVEVDNAAVFIEAVKCAERPEENAIIIRLCEHHNTRGEVVVTVALPVAEAWLCNLLEENLIEIPIDNGEMMLPIHPFEVITVKLVLR